MFWTFDWNEEIDKEKGLEKEEQTKWPDAVGVSLPRLPSEEWGK